MSGRHIVEVVRGRLSDRHAEEITGFWAAHGALTGAAAQERLAEVVCVLRDSAGGVIGVNSVFDEPVALIANRRFWVYRRFLGPEADDGDEVAMVLAAFEALATGHAPGDGGPVGLCLYVEDPEFLRRHPEAVWPQTDLLYAGYLPDGRQVRIRYFDDALIA